MSYKFKTDATRSNNMCRIRSRDTSPELKLRLALWHKGVRYRVDYSRVPGRPDIAVVNRKVAIFVDGAFWHGHNWEEKRPRITANRDYWIPKIERTMERDVAATAELEGLGWCVLRFWDFQVHKDLDSCVATVLRQLAIVPS